MKRKEIEKSIHRHIRIADLDSFKLIDEIINERRYKSFGKVINHTQLFGLPILRMSCLEK